MNRTFRGLLITALFVSCEHELPINPNENALTGTSTPVAASSNTFFKKFVRGTSATGTSLIKTYDGGYAFAGEGVDEHIFMYLVKTDRCGNFQWDHFGYNGSSYCVRQTCDNGIIFIGNNGPVGTTTLTKFDKLGTLQWRKNHDNFFSGQSIALAGNNGYVATGTAFDTTPTFSEEAAVGKFNIFGDLLWIKTFGDNMLFSSIEQTSDNGFIIAGTIWNNSNADLLLLKIDTQGNTQWQSTFGCQYSDQGNHAIQTSDGGYVAIGSNSKSSDNKIRQVYIVKVTSNGKYQWIRGNSPSNYADGLRIRETPDYGFAIAAYTYGKGTLIRTCSNGAFQWRKHYPDSILQKPYDIVAESNGGYTMVGSCTGNDTVHGYASLVKVNSQGNF